VTSVIEWFQWLFTTFSTFTESAPYSTPHHSFQRSFSCHAFHEVVVNISSRFPSYIGSATPKPLLCRFRLPAFPLLSSHRPSIKCFGPQFLRIQALLSPFASRNVERVPVSKRKQKSWIKPQWPRSHGRSFMDGCFFLSSGNHPVSRPLS